eukprot:TRINITY_DN31655_c0_g1_i2.p1 TRINITY_DN31655_c0_g1~~TRINITY_DN31655_c0_g1_i2.p1  ORF type:complete len:584 (+),score=93.77 TRINITY_DN31655_c0_g1_i2:73-1824(+)
MAQWGLAQGGAWRRPTAARRPPPAADTSSEGEDPAEPAAAAAAAPAAAGSSAKGPRRRRCVLVDAAPGLDAAPVQAAGAAAPAGVAEWMRANGVQVRGADDLEPVRDLAAAPFGEATRAMLQQRFAAPRLVQSVVWPLATSGRDVVALAATGTGKTLAYLLPCLAAIGEAPKPLEPGSSPIAVVMAPTHELARQIWEQAMSWRCGGRDVPATRAGPDSGGDHGIEGEEAAGRSHSCRCVVVYGGVSPVKQARELHRGAHLVVATPGRLQDLLKLDGAMNPRPRPACDTDDVAVWVIDEADRMVDAGFEPALRSIARALPRRRQTLMVSATWPPEAQQIAQSFMRRPVHVSITAAAAGDACPAPDGPSRVTQVLLQARGDAEKREAFRRFLAESGQWGVAAALHGDMPQTEREAVVLRFGSGDLLCVVATDVASRGLHFADVGLVINYDFPATGCDAFVHRVGRAGRSGREARAVTIFDTSPGKMAGDRRFAAPLVAILEAGNHRVPPWLQRAAEQSRCAGPRRWGTPPGSPTAAPAAAECAASPAAAKGHSCAVCGIVGIGDLAQHEAGRKHRRAVAAAATAG